MPPTPPGGTTPQVANNPNLDERTYSYEYGAAVDSGTSDAPKWNMIRWASAIDPSRSPKTKDAATYDDKGAANAPVVGEDWTLSFTMQGRRDTATGRYQPELEALLACTGPDAVGTRATAHVMWFDKPADPTSKPNPDDAFEGYGTVDIKRGATDNDSIGQFNVTITGQGRRTRIKNPYDPATGTLKFT